METKEVIFKGFKMNGFLAVFLFVFIWAGLMVWCFMAGDVLFKVLGCIMVVLWIILNCGYIMLEPNEARAMVFFGKYKGTFRETGFFWVNPFMGAKNSPCAHGTWTWNRSR